MMHVIFIFYCVLVTHKCTYLWGAAWCFDTCVHSIMISQVTGIPTLKHKHYFTDRIVTLFFRNTCYIVIKSWHFTVRENTLRYTICVYVFLLLLFCLHAPQLLLTAVNFHEAYVFGFYIAGWDSTPVFLCTACFT